MKRRGIKAEEKMGMDTIATLIPSLSDEERVGAHTRTKEEGSGDKSDRVGGKKKKGFSRRKCSKKGTRYGSYPRLWPRESVRRRGLHGSHIHLSRYSLSIRGTKRNESSRVDVSSARECALWHFKTTRNFVPDLHVKRKDERKKGSFDPADWNCPSPKCWEFIEK